MIRVGVIRGGISSEYEVSLNTGANVLAHLRSEAMADKYKAVDILIDKEGIWHINGIPTTLDSVSNKVDLIMNALHGDFGEDGKVQILLEQWGIPYTGSGPFSSALGYNKALAKERFKSLGIKTPQSVIITMDSIDREKEPRAIVKDQASFVWSKIAPPWVVKPVSSDSSFEVKICKTFPELENALLALINGNVDILIEEHIKGKEAKVGIVESFRGKDLYTLPPSEIGNKGEICPGNFTNAEKEELQHLASFIHSSFNLDHYSKSDFMVHPKRGIYVLGIDTQPDLNSESSLSKGLESVGSSIPEFLSHIIKLAHRT